MDRRKSLKLLATGVLATPIAIASCKPGEEKIKAGDISFHFDRNPDELKRDTALMNRENVFSEHEMATIGILADIIIPKDEISGSATNAKVPDFIAFIVKDMPQHEVPMKGGLRWLDMQCLKRYEKSFKESSPLQQLEMVDLIAYPNRAKDNPELKPGVSFFSLMRNLTATGFYTSEIGVKDIGYAGNKPTQWNGVPEEVLQQYKLAYTEKELKECVSFTKA